MKWEERYATGIAKIDEQHQTIFNMVDDFQITLDEGKGSSSYDILLNLLAKYSENHFCYEEICMKEFACPVAAKNKLAHSDFTNLVNKYQLLYQQHGFQHNDAKELVNTIELWFKGHICNIDIHLKKCVKKLCEF